MPSVTVIRMTPKGPLKGQDFLRDFLDRFGKDLDCVMIVAMSNDGDIVDGWCANCNEKIVTSLGMLEQMKLDFWDSCFTKRSD